jgi:hypothetical protein
MKYRIAKTVTAIALTAAALSGCGGGDDGMSGAMSTPAAATSTGAATSTSAAPTMQSLDTAQVLTQARQLSETESPYTVDDGMLRITGTSDSAEPLGIDGT